MLCKNELMVKQPWRVILSYLHCVVKNGEVQVEMRFAQGCLESQCQNQEENSYLMTLSPRPAYYLPLCRDSLPMSQTE